MIAYAGDACWRHMGWLGVTRGWSSQWEREGVDVIIVNILQL